MDLTHDAQPLRRPAQRLTSRYAVPVLRVLLFGALALRLIWITPFPAPDELQHVSYAAAVQENHRLLPRFEQQKTLRIDDFTRWTERPNYIGHPAPFYWLESLFLDRNAPPGRAIFRLRLTTLALVGLGVWLSLRCGAANLAPDRWAAALFCAACMFCPRLLASTAQVTNDALAVLGGALALYGTLLPRSRGADVAAGSGLLLALWAKPNAGLEAGVFLMIVMLLRPPQRLRPPLAWILGGAIGVLPYVFIVLRYGTIVPVTAESFGDVAHASSLGGYVPAFLLHIGQTWGHLRTITYPVAATADWLMIAAFWAMIACTVTALPRALREADTPGAAVAAAAPLALVLMIPLHFWFAATQLGYSLPAAAFRYYLALWPALAFSLGFAVRRGASPSRRIGISGTVVAALAMGWAC